MRQNNRASQSKADQGHTRSVKVIQGQKVKILITILYNNDLTLSDLV